MPKVCAKLVELSEGLGGPCPARAAQKQRWGSPATVDTLANRLHCSTPKESVTITMPPFFF